MGKEKGKKKALQQRLNIHAVISRFFCKHNYLWVRNVYGDEIYMTGKFKRSWWKCNKCGKRQSKEQLYTEGRS